MPSPGTNPLKSPETPSAVTTNVLEDWLASLRWRGVCPPVLAISGILIVFLSQWLDEFYSFHLTSGGVDSEVFKERLFAFHFLGISLFAWAMCLYITRAIRDTHPPRPDAGDA